MHFQKILYATDFSELSQLALRYAAELAHDYGAHLLILHVVDTLGPENVTYGEAVSQLQPEGFRQRLWEELHRIESPCPGVPVEYLLREGEVAEAIIQTAGEQHCDLIVMASHDRPWLQRLFLSGMAERVVRLAPCPVMVVKPTQPLPPQGPQVEIADLHPGQLGEKDRI